MIIQACLNGARPRDYHPDIPWSPGKIAQQGAACVAVGAAELHIHPRAAEGHESLTAIDETVLAVRRACPGTLIGVSTGAWIEKSGSKTCRCIERWHERPDYASVNLSEPDASAVIDVLHRVGVRVEAGLASIADAKKFLTHRDRDRVFRILIEIEEQDLQVAYGVAEGIIATLNEGELRRPMLLHGFDATVWPFVALAIERRWSTRVGLEDGRLLPNGSIAPHNAALVAAAVQAFRKV